MALFDQVVIHNRLNIVADLECCVELPNTGSYVEPKWDLYDELVNWKMTAGTGGMEQLQC